MAAPPRLEPEIARRLRIDLGIEIILLCPKSIGRVLVFEVLHQPGAVELSPTKIAGQRGEPAAAEKTAGVAHRIFAPHARPVGQWRSGENERSEQLRTERRQHHDRPACLAVPDHAGLAVGTRMELAHFFEKDRLGACDVLDRLSVNRIGQEADEIARMAGLEGNADLAVGLEAADPRPMAGARVNHHERTSGRIDCDILGRNDPCQDVIDRPVEGAAIDHQLGIIIEDMRSVLGEVLVILVAPLPQHVPEQDASLAGIDKIFESGSERPWA
jgi:hypothetical protein